MEDDQNGRRPYPKCLFKRIRVLHIVALRDFLYFHRIFQRASHMQCITLPGYLPILSFSLTLFNILILGIIYLFIYMGRFSFSSFSLYTYSSNCIFFTKSVDGVGASAGASVDVGTNAGAHSGVCAMVVPM